MHTKAKLCLCKQHHFKFYFYISIRLLPSLACFLPQQIVLDVLSRVIHIELPEKLSVENLRF